MFNKILAVKNFTKFYWKSPFIEYFKKHTLDTKEVRPGTRQTSKMESFATIFNSYKLATPGHPTVFC